MASITKITYPPKKDGSRSSAWRVRWYDATGREREKAFSKKRDAEAFAAEKTLRPGSIGRDRLADIVGAYLASYERLVEAGERRETSLRQRRQHLERHFIDHPIGRERAGEIRASALQKHIDALIAGGVSLALARKVLGSIRHFWKWAAARDFVEAGIADAASVPISSIGKNPRRRIPTKAECKAILEASDGRTASDRGKAAAFVRVVMFAGLRAGEARALQWRDIDLNAGTIRIRRSADKYQTIHETPKSVAGNRSVPIGPETIQALRVWRLACPQNELELAFPNQHGAVWRHDHLYRNLWIPVMRAAGLAEKRDTPRKRKDAKGRIYNVPEWRPEFGPHTARHIAASIWIEQSARAGSPVSQKWIQEKIGHSTIKLTLDVYGHLWESAADDAAIAAAAERFFD